MARQAPDLAVPRDELLSLPFIWAAGIEDTFVPQATERYRALDEYQLMGHYDHWREDLALLRDLGVTMVRWGVPWYRVEPGPGAFDWSWTDQVLPYLVEDLGVTVLLDLIHYGCPLWLERAFAEPSYPEAVAHYAAAVARRYAGLVTWYTPANEPSVAADQSGRRGVWPPYLHGGQGYARVFLAVVEGVRHTVEAIKEVDPRAVMVHVEAAGWTKTAEPDLMPLESEDTLRRYLYYDLLTGLVTPDHPLFPWLVRHGVAPGRLRDMARHPIALDVVGLNFYPQWSARDLYLDRDGHLANRAHQADGVEFAAMIGEYYQRYAAPLMITETSAFGSNRARADWLHASVNAVDQLRRRGVPIIGYTWFPLFTMIDWRYRLGRAPLERYRLELGLYQLCKEGGGSRWLATPLAARFRAYIEHFAMAVASPRETKAKSETGA